MLRLTFPPVVLIAALATPAWAQSPGGGNPTFKPAPPAASPGENGPTKKNAPTAAPKTDPAPAPTSTPAPPKTPPAPPPTPDTLPATSQAYPPPPVPAGPPAPAAANPPGPPATDGAAPSPAPAPPPGWPPPGAWPPPGTYAAPPPGSPPAGTAAPGTPPPGYPPQPGYPPPGYAYPGYPPYGYPPPGYAYPGYPYQPYPNAYAYGPPAKRPGWHKHDGFYLGMATGLGGFSYTTSNVANKGELSGTGISLEFSVGAALTPHLILFGTLYEINSASNPTFKVNGNGGNSSGDVMLIGIGPGVAYYFGEHNFYASGALAFSQLHFDSGLDGLNRIAGDSNWGLALKVTFGKEWWISENWAMGLGAQLVLGSIKDNQLTASGNEATSSNDPSWGVGAFNVLFSATYN